MRVKINISQIGLTVMSQMPQKRDMKRILKGLGAAAMQKWTSLAKTELQSTSRDYVNGLTYGEAEGRVFVALTGMIPNMIEGGWRGGDLRQWLLKGKNAKIGKNGQPYNTVPFRHGTPGTGGRNVGPSMPGEIHKEAKKLKATLSRPGESATGRKEQTVAWGERLNLGRPGMSAAAMATLSRKEQPWHATSVYTGMVRKAQETAKGPKTSGYTTFRRISAVSRGPQHWYHPGIKARNLAKKTQKHVEAIAIEIVKNAIGPKE